MSSHLLEGLNKEQKEAVLATEGPLLILAGAGSGKTKALTHRIAYLIEEKHIPPSNILAVTFTNKAAKEMKERMASMLGDESKVPLMGTFHSICVQFLRRHIHHLGIDNSFTIYDGGDQVALMKEIFKNSQISNTQFNEKTILGGISKAKSKYQSPEDYAREVHSSFSEIVAQVYPKYVRALHKANALDFDDLLMKTIELFEAQPEVLRSYQERFQYVCVDEYQDTNHVQYLLMNMLGKLHGNICVIGDDWQSIYSWRGANMQNILDFEKDYPNARVIRLEQNYRSTKTIVEAANAVIKCNEGRSEKTLWTEKEGEQKIIKIEARDERDEGEKVIGSILSHMRERGATFKDFAVLYRMNAQSRILEESLMRHGVPYRIVGGVRFYERKEIKDVLSYLKLTQNPTDDVALLRIINVPARKIGGVTLQKVREVALMEDSSMLEAAAKCAGEGLLSPAANKSLLQFLEVMSELRKANKEFGAGAVIRHILKLAKYEEYLLDGSDEGQQRLANVEELISVASKYDGLEPGIALATFLEEVALISDVDSLDTKDDAVVLMTLHSSKGLEFPTVYLVGLEEGIFPSSRSQLDKEAMEEERRLMYVGMTRAKDKLYLSYAKSRLLYGNYTTPLASRFFDEIPPQYYEETDDQRTQNLVNDAYSDVSYTSFDEDVEIVEYVLGDAVEHDVWGKGRVVGVQGGIISVSFLDPTIGTKKLAVTVAPIRKVGG